MIWIASAAAQDTPPSYQADPSTYKVIFEDQSFRVIAATWKKGETDKPHSHPLPFVVYALDDCAVRVHKSGWHQPRAQEQSRHGLCGADHILAHVRKSRRGGLSRHFRRAQVIHPAWWVVRQRAIHLARLIAIAPSRTR